MLRESTWPGLTWIATHQWQESLLPADVTTMISNVMNSQNSANQSLLIHFLIQLSEWGGGRLACEGFYELATRTKRQLTKDLRTPSPSFVFFFLHISRGGQGQNN